MAEEEKSVGSLATETCSEMAVSPPSDETQNEFEVEKIVAMAKTKGKKTLYRVRWLGYGSDHDTWEPYENLESCREMIDQFIKDERKKKKERYKKRTRTESQTSATATTSNVPQTEKRGPTWKYVAQDEEEYDTLKDKFWRDLEQGKVDVFKAGDMYSKVKASDRASRPKSFSDMFKNKLPIVDGIPQTTNSTRGEKSRRGRGQLNNRGRPKRGRSSSEGKSKKQVKQSGRMKRGCGIRGRSCVTSSSDDAGRQLSVYGDLQTSALAKEHLDSISVTSCDTLSSTLSSVSPDTHHMALSEDSSLPGQTTTQDDSGKNISTYEGMPHFNQFSASKDPVSCEVDVLPRADGTTDPSSVASSTTTSASSANESGIVVDSCPERLHLETSNRAGDVPTPGDCGVMSDSASMADVGNQVHMNCRSDVTEDFDKMLVAGVSPRQTTTATTVTEPYHGSEDVLQSGLNVNAQSQSLYPDQSSEPSTYQSTLPAPSCLDDQMTRHDDTDMSSYVRQTSVNSQLVSDGSTLGLGLTAEASSEQMPLNQIQPTIGTLVSDKTLLNNNKGETGDEEFEFDLDEIDPSEWQGKVIPRLPWPETLDLSNAEIHHLVQTNNYEQLEKALATNKTYDLEQADITGLTLVMIAAQHGYDDVLELLVLKGANVNSEQKNGTTALMLACEKGFRCTVALLLMLGAHMNKHNHAGETALIKAVKCGHKHIVKELLDHGANFASMYNMDSPLKYARHQHDILDLFNSHISRLTAEFEHQVQITLNNTARIICALFPMQCFALREAERLKVIFKHELQPTKPGVGMLLFVAHARITAQEVRCRFYGPCAVLCTVLNGVKLDPLTEGGNFVMSFCPLHNGKNELELLTAKAPTSEAKLIVCAYKAQLI